ncbi:MAG: GNAT family N-acetyltransferase [Bauldia sp.]|nr:GNAT family N-acetyltransferase [Bauldia sp.]
MAVDVIECVGTEAFQAVWPVMRQLRSTISEDQFLARVKAAQGQGYRLFAAFQEGRPVGAIGWRIVDDLASGRSLYIDDLVADEAARGTGVGRSLMDFARAHAARLGCTQLRLNSGFQRKGAHAFYAAIGLPQRGYAYGEDVPSGG